MSVFLSVGVLVLHRINMQHCWGFLTMQQSVLQHNLSDFFFFFLIKHFCFREICIFKFCFLVVNIFISEVG